MKFLLSVILIAALSAIAAFFLPWWSVAVVAFLVALVTGGRGFLTGFVGVGLCWLLVALFRDIPNEHILSDRMAVLFHLPNHILFVAVTALVGGLIGGLAAWAGASLKPQKRVPVY